MLLQATYNYEAYATVLANAFAKKKIEWRTKTFSEEYEERNMTNEEYIHMKRHESAVQLDTLRRNFLIAKASGELTG